MAYDSLREFIKRLEAERELVRIGKEVSVDLEIAAISDLVMKSEGGGKALLFTNVKGSSMPVLVNAFGSKKRMELALGAAPDEIGARIEELIKTGPPQSIGDVFGMLPKLSALRAAVPKRIRSSSPPCREVVMAGDAVDLGRLPVLKTWPGDGGPFVTFPCVFTRDPATGRQNVGMYRLQVYDRRTTGMHWHIHKDGAANHRAGRKSGRRMEVAVAIGTDPVVTWAATAPLPRGLDEMMLAGFISGRPVELVKCLTVDVWVPATAEIVLEGYVDPVEERIEGPFGDHTGYYSPADPYPVFHVTAVTHRRDPVYSTTVVGIPPMEDVWMGWATERIFLPLLRTQWPEVAGMSLPKEGVFHNLCLVSMEKTYPRQAHRLMSGFWGAGQMSFTKIVAVLDSDVDVTDHRAAARAVLDRARIPESLVFGQGVLDALDHSSPHPLWGGKLGVDATLPAEGEPGGRIAQKPAVAAQTPEEVYSYLKGGFAGLKACLFPVPEARLKLCLLVAGRGEIGDGAALAAAALEIDGIDVAVAVEGEAGEDVSRLAWRALSSVDPLRDVKISGAKLAVDALSKRVSESHPRVWPEEVAHPPEMTEKARRFTDEVGLRVP